MGRPYNRSVADPAVVLFWGDDEFLLRLAAHEFFAARGVRAVEVDAAEWQGGETSDLATPSLWGEARALLVTQCQSFPESGSREIAAYVKAPSPEALCVLTYVTRGKSGPALARVVQAAGGAVHHVQLRRTDLPKWLVDRARSRGMRLAGPAATALIGTLGEDAGTLDQAIEQLVTAFAGKPVGPEEVRSQFQGVGEQRVWDLCDRALAGRLPEALVVLRSLLEGREDPLLIVGGIAARLRELVKVRSLPDRMAPAEAARAAGVRFDWQVRRYREQAARYSLEELTELQGAVTDADRAIKGGTPGDVVLSALVAAMAGDREAALTVPVRVGR